MYKIIAEFTGIKWKVILKQEHTGRYDKFLESVVCLKCEREAKERALALAKALFLSEITVRDSLGEDIIPVPERSLNSSQ
jgi:lantibiotic modifying enzyme